MPQRSLARVAVFVLLAGCFILSEAAWSTTALSNASKKARTVVGNSPFKKQLGGGLEQGSSSFLGRKGGSAEVSSDAASGIAVDEKGKKEGSRFGFLGPSDSSKGVGVTEGGNGASNGLFVAADEESEIRGATGSLEETENSLNREKRSPYTKTKITAKARPSGALDNDTSLLAGGEAALETPLEATESDDSIVEDGRSDSGDEKSEAEAGNAEGKGWRTWGWFAKPKVVNSSELAAPSPLQAALADRANNTESEGPEVEAGDESEEGFEGGEQEENSENLGRDVDVEEDEETDDVAGEGMADLRKVILDSVARAIKGGNASEAEKLLNDLFSKKKEAGNVSSFPENLTSLSAAEPTLDSATLQLENVTSFSEAKKRVGSEEESPNARTSVWSRLVGGEEERTGSKSEGGLPKSATLAGRGSVGTASEGSEGAAQRAANSSGSDAVSSTKSGGFWGRLVGGGAKGKGKEMREEILAEPEEEGEQVGTTGVDEERISEQREEGLLRKPEEKNVGGIRVREGEESGGSTKGVNGLEDSRFGEKGKRVATKKKDEVTSSVDGEEEEEEGNEEAALPYRKQVGLGNLKKEGVDEVGARTKDGENVKTGKGKLREVPGLGVPSVLNVTTEVARLVHRAGEKRFSTTCLVRVLTEPSLMRAELGLETLTCHDNVSTQEDNRQAVTGVATFAKMGTSPSHLIRPPSLSTGRGQSSGIEVKINLLFC